METTYKTEKESDSSFDNTEFEWHTAASLSRQSCWQDNSEILKVLI